MDYEKFKMLLGDWGEKLRPFIESKECDILYAKLKEEVKKGKIICPLGNEVYRTFLETPISELKVVFMLLDPYPRVINGIRTADGIAMSCSHTKNLQPSLELFYDGIIDDLYKKDKEFVPEKLNDLKYLCNQGVMMLNTALTVEKDITGSHTKIWRPFMKFLFEEVFNKMGRRLIFVLCGKESEKMEGFIDPLQHIILKREHPAFAARQERKWKHEKVFSQINWILDTDKIIKPHWMYEKAPF